MTTIPHIGRRAFLGRAGALASVAGSLESLHAAGQKGAQPKNIIFMVADGMSASVLPMAEHFSRHVRGKGLLWRALIDRPEAVQGLMDMASLDSAVTDSAAASSSWGSGSRIFNGSVNVLPDGTKLTPIAAVSRDMGRKVGLVTTTTVTHATPAGFAAVQSSRGSEEDIAAQYLRQVDVVLGGGRQYFESATRKDKRDLVEEYRRAGFSQLVSRDELLRVKAGAGGSQKLLGLFSPGMIPYTLDRNHSPELQRSVPTLAEMAEAALRTLESAPKGFLLQVEGGRVDHAAHSNDAASQMWEQLAFDDAIEVVLKFAGRHPETLIVITADHGNSNPAIGGRWAEWNGASNAFQTLASAKSSYSQVIPKLSGQEKPSAALVQELAREAFGFAFSSEEVEAVRSSAAGVKKLCVNARLDKLAGILGQAVGNHTGVGWVSTDHTSDYVLLTALGPGREGFAGHIRNTRCFENMMDLMGVKFRNPSMSVERARSFLRAAVELPGQPHWV